MIYTHHDIKVLDGGKSHLWQDYKSLDCFEDDGSGSLNQNSLPPWHMNVFSNVGNLKELS